MKLKTLKNLVQQLGELEGGSVSETGAWEYRDDETGELIVEEVVRAVMSGVSYYGEDVDQWPSEVLLSFLSHVVVSNVSSTPYVAFTDNGIYAISEEDYVKRTMPESIKSLSGQGEPTKGKKRTLESLTDEEISHIKSIHNSDLPYIDKFRQIFETYGIRQRTAQGWFNTLGFTKKPEEPEFLKEAKNRTLNKLVHFVTCAQNATPIHQQMWENMVAYADKHDAEIRVIPIRYKNPTSVHQDLDQDYWAKEVIPHLDLTRHSVVENLMILGDLKIQPTAEFPLRGLNAITKGSSAIIGHPKMHLECVPVLEGEHKQTLWTTGAVTIENYTDSKAGAKGESHHIFGFVVIETYEHSDRFHIRHVPVCDDGSFQDLYWEVKDGEVTPLEDSLASSFVLGDLHIGDHDEDKMDRSIDLIHTLRPEHIVIHDIFNGHSVNHHESKNGVKSFHRLKKNRHLLRKELDDMIEYVSFLSSEFNWAKIVIVRSNHDEWLDRYIVDQNWRNDIANAAVYSECLSLLLNEECDGLVPYFINKEKLPNVICLTRDTSYCPNEYNMANHGDLGINGSRGTALQYSKLNKKQVIGHGHAAYRINGLAAVGTSTKLRCGYNVGPSNWSHADFVEYPNGKGTHIIYDEYYEFSTFKLNS